MERAGQRSRAHRTALRVGAAAIAGLALLSAPLRAEDRPEHVSVVLDKAKLIKLPAGVETVIVGNPSIADVTMLRRNNLMVVTGKGFGETNVIFLDAAGQAVSEAAVTVSSGNSIVTVQRGMDRESYSCAPRCQPSVQLGDATKFLTDSSSQITARNSLVVSGQH